MSNRYTKLGLARQSFVKMVRNKAEMETHAMALFIDPDATPEQIAQAREMLLSVTKPMTNAVTTLRNRYPYVPVILANHRPWHRSEFNKYDQTQENRA